MTRCISKDRDRGCEYRYGFDSVGSQQACGLALGGLPFINPTLIVHRAPPEAAAAPRAQVRLVEDRASPPLFFLPFGGAERVGTAPAAAPKPPAKTESQVSGVSKRCSHLAKGERCSAGAPKAGGAGAPAAAPPNSVVPAAAAAQTAKHQQGQSQRTHTVSSQTQDTAADSPPVLAAAPKPPNPPAAAAGAAAAPNPPSAGAAAAPVAAPNPPNPPVAVYMRHTTGR